MAGKAGKAKKIDAISPTPEQMARGEYELSDILDKQPNGRMLSIGKAYRKVPVIDTLHAKGMFSDKEHKALHYYRHHADVVSRSLIRDSLCKDRHGGSGNGPTAAYITATEIVRDCERAAGQLVDILRAIVVEDVTLSQWAINQAGGIHDCEMKKGQKVCRIKPRQKALDIAKLEIRMAAVRVEAELAA